MHIRPVILHLLIASLLATGIACNGAPRPGPRRPGTEPRPEVRTRLPPAPKGPDVFGDVTLSFEVDGLARLDKRIIALLPPTLARVARGQALARLVPGIARSLRLNPLVQNALDHSRSSAFAVIVGRKGKTNLRLQLLAVLPVKGDGKLVIDAVKDSYESTTQAPWGGLEIKRDGKTVAWLRVYKGWAVVAPSAPLLDSAYRYLVPRARKLPAGRVRAHLNARLLIREIKPLVTEGWRKLSSSSGDEFDGSFGNWLAQHRADLEKIGAHLASLGSVSFELQANQADWRWQLDVRPQQGGPLARWIAKQQVGAGFGLKVLPPGPFVALSHWVAPDLRSLVHRLVSSFTELHLLGRLTYLLPRQVARRGLYKRKRPASYSLYRKTLRDLKPQDFEIDKPKMECRGSHPCKPDLKPQDRRASHKVYRASHRVYLVLWHVHAFFRHLKKALPPLLKTHAGQTAGAFYATAGPGLGFAFVRAIKNRRHHARLYQRALWGTLQSLNRLATKAWKLMSAQSRKLLGQRSPLQFVFRQTALRVGRTPVSTVALRIKWPRKPQGKVTRTQQNTHREIARYRKLVETVFGAGDLTWAWTYVDKRLLVSAGRGWKPRILAMVKAAQGKDKSSPTLAQDPLYKGFIKPPARGTTRLGLMLSSATRLVAALMRGLFKFDPQLNRFKEFRMANLFLQQIARQARAGTLLEVLRLGGAYRIQSRLSTSDVQALLLLVGYFLSATPGPVSTSNFTSKAQTTTVLAPVPKLPAPKPPAPKPPLHQP